MKRGTRGRGRKSLNTFYVKRNRQGLEGKRGMGEDGW
jgi:hypothetical protein